MVFGWPFGNNGADKQAERQELKILAESRVIYLIKSRSETSIVAGQSLIQLYLLSKDQQVEETTLPDTDEDLVALTTKGRKLVM